MTREEAKNWLNKLYARADITDEWGDMEDMQKYEEAVNMAIQALEKEPCEDWYDVPSNEMTLEQARQAVKDLRKKLAEHLKQKPCEDAISRQDAIDVICAGSLSAATVYGRTDKGMAALKETVKLIKKLPSVTPAPKMGRWVEVTDEETPTTRTWHYECSECGTPLKAVEKTRCCSECGALLLVDAKMEGIEK